MPRLAAMSRILGRGSVPGTERGRGRSQEVTRFPPGDEVFSTAKGALAECAWRSESNLTPKQANLTFRTGGRGRRARPDRPARPARPRAGRAGPEGVDHSRVGRRRDPRGTAGQDVRAQITGVCNTMKEDPVRSIGAADACQRTSDTAKEPASQRAPRSPAATR